MFPQSPQANISGGLNTSPILQQQNSLLGHSAFSPVGALPTVDPYNLNSTAPQSTASPAVAGMVKALRGTP